MGRKIFLSFDYGTDHARAAQIRSSLLFQDKQVAGYLDAESWAALAAQGEDAIKDWILAQMTGTTVTVTLVGANTATCKYVKHALLYSWERNNGIVGIYIHRMRTPGSNVVNVPPPNPFLTLGYSDVRLHDWVMNDGYKNVGNWIEAAFKQSRISSSETVKIVS